MIIVEILIPLTSNEGATFTEEHHYAFESYLATIFGGWSRLSGTITGGWQDAGVLFTDETRVYALAVPSLLTDGPKVVHVVEIAKAHYGQRAIFVRYLAHAEIL